MPFLSRSVARYGAKFRRGRGAGFGAAAADSQAPGHSSQVVAERVAGAARDTVLLHPKARALAGDLDSVRGQVSRGQGAVRGAAGKFTFDDPDRRRGIG